MNVSNLEYAGLWWLPENPSIQYIGKLTISTKFDFNLELFESFVGKRQIFENLQFPIILGVADGRQFTLVDCTRLQTSEGFPGIIHSNYSMRKILNGIHLSNPDEIKLKSLSVQFTYLNEWINFSGIQSEIANNTRGVTISYEKPDSIMHNIGDSLAIWIGFVGNFANLFSKTEVNLKEDKILRFVPMTEKNLKNLDSLSHLVQHFLTLMIGNRVYPLKTYGRCKNNQISAESPNPEIVFEIIKKPRGFSEDFKPLRSMDLRTQYSEIRGQMDTFLRNWIDKSDRLSSTSDLYFSTLYLGKLTAENHFLRMAQALESYHQRMIGGVFLSPEAYLETKKMLTTSIPPLDIEDYDEFKQSLSSRIKYGYSYSFKKRIDEIVRRYDDIFTPSILDISEFVKTVRDTRDYLTHYEVELQEKAASGSELYYLARDLEDLVKMCLMTEIGLSNAKIKEMLSN